MVSELPVAPPLAARELPLQHARHPCSQRAAPAAHSLPLQPARWPCSPLATPAACSPPLRPAHRPRAACSPPLQPARRSLAARSPPLQPARRPCGPLTALVARSPPTCSPLAARLRPACRPCSPLAAPAARSPPACRPCSPLAASLRPARRPCSPLAACLQPSRNPLATRSPPLAARSPPLAACAPPLAARSLPPAARSPALAARAPPSGSPLAAPLQPACRPPCSPRGPVLARSSTVRPCPAVPSGSLSGLHLPSFYTNLVSTAALQDAMVTTTTLGGQRVLICTCTRTGRHLATFNRRPGPSLYTLVTEPPQVAASAQVFASGPVAPPCSCHLLSHQTLLWHHRLGHPSLPRLRGMHSHLLVSSLPRSLPPLPPSPAPPCLLCVEGWQRAAPHSSFPPTTAPLQTLHMDVWGPACGEVPDVLIPWIRTVRLQLRERFREDLHLFALPASPQQNGIAERRIGLVMELNLWPHVSLPETSPTLRWTGQVGDASVFRVWGSRAFVRDKSTDKLSARAIPCVFLGFPPDAPGWQFYHPTSHRVLPSQDVTFDESVPFYRVSQVDPLPRTVRVEVAVDSGAAKGVASGGAASGGAEPTRAEPGGAEPAGAEPGGAESEGAGSGGAEPGAWSEGAESGGAEPRGTASFGGRADASPCQSPRLEPFSPQLLREWFAQLTHLQSGGAGAGGSAAGGTGAGGTRAFDPGARGDGAGGAAPGGTGAGGTMQRRPFFVPPQPSSLSPPDSVLCQVLKRREHVSHLASTVRTSRWVPRPRPPPVPDTHVMTPRPSSVPLRVPLLPPPESSLPAIPDPEFDLARVASPTVPHLLATVVTDPSFESTAASAIVAELVDFGATCRLDYATSLVAESKSDFPLSVGGECALGTDVLEDRQEDFECLAAAVPHLVAMLLAPEGDPDAQDIPTPRSYAETVTGPYSSQWQTAMDAKMASSKSTGTYVDAVPPSRANIVDGMTAYTRRSGCATHLASLGRFLQVPSGASGGQSTVSARCLARTMLAALGFAPLTADPSLFLRIDTSVPPFYVLVYVDNLVFTTADTEALALVLQRFGFQYSSPQSTPLHTGHSLSAPPLDETVEPSGSYPELVGYLMYLMTCTRPNLAYPLSIMARYVAPGRHRPEHWEAAKRVLRYLCSTLGMGLVLGGRGPVVLTGYADASWVDDLATLRSSQGYTFSLGFGSVSWRSTHSYSVLSSSCEAEIYAGAMAAQELRWLTYLLTDLGEQPRSSPICM
ncbi:unnamed protein product [Closterium sp. NIES-53]